MSTDETIKKFVGGRYNIDPKDITEVYFDHRHGTCGYGTCEYNDFIVEVLTKKDGKSKRREEVEYVSDFISELVAYAADH